MSFNILPILLLHLTINEETIGQFHPIFLHFPIVLFSAALITDLLNYFGKKGAFIVGHWLIIAGVVMCIPTIITGLAAAAGFDPNDELLAKHSFLGYATGVAGSLYAGLRISAMQWTLPLKPSHYLGLSLMLVALVSWTSDYGGLITRGVTPFSLKGESAAVQGMSQENLKELSQAATPDQLKQKLMQYITLSQVIPIFAAHQCQSCHADQFAGGKPQNFFQGKHHPFLERNPDGTLKDFSTSNFYQTVVLENRMPMDHKGLVLGLTPGERLVLLAWLQNGAPME